ncbi:hypothetical protein M0R45_030014 [Rubus argutus]|uniref:Uncharacterized protein n=1 Tax=Rubus argutus TaxID=59490 RepID=A0AAW1WBW1_RUBAR
MPRSTLRLSDCHRPPTIQSTSQAHFTITPHQAPPSPVQVPHGSRLHPSFHHHRVLPSLTSFSPPVAGTFINRPEPSSASLFWTSQAADTIVPSQSLDSLKLSRSLN